MDFQKTFAFTVNIPASAMTDERGDLATALNADKDRLEYIIKRFEAINRENEGKKINDSHSRRYA